MKRYLTLLLAMVLVIGVFAGCGQQEPIQTDMEEGRFTFPTLPMPSINYPMDDETTDTTEATEPLPMEVENYQLVTDSTTLRADSGKMKYVMIYNPEVYDEDAYYNMTRSTGDLSNQINVDLARADGLEKDYELLTMDQNDLNKDIPYDEFDLSGDRASFIPTIYKKGDTKVFYTYTSNSTAEPRISRSFNCRYAGIFCNVWVYEGSISDEQAQKYGEEFDSTVYLGDTMAFGEGRFTDNGGKVNLLYYPMPRSLGGCFCMLDLYATGEVTAEQIQQYGINTDHALVHLNADLASKPEKNTFMTSTLAHEFQHLICGTDYFYTVNYVRCRTWLNEAMSGYAEELLFPGSKVEGGHVDCFMTSDRIRQGQSLYNFETSTTQDDYDIGVYGSVYLYSEYLARLAGPDVYSMFHWYWRNSMSTSLSEAEALVHSVDTQVYDAIDQSIPYPFYMTFASEEEKWMSKLTLQFYLELLDEDLSDPADYSYVQNEYLLYDEINAAQIEGGGRIIFALEGDTYQIPQDADMGLIYVGLDENFDVVTPLLYR